jgi:methylenetetrahydrofolate dehydrogenase (NADP+)/methenyltetrahydrofolate cyclohydrolase
MTAKIIDGRKIGAELNKKTKNEVDYYKSKYDIIPKITTIKIGDDPTSNLYLRLRDNACHNAGILSNHLIFSSDVSEKEIIENIHSLNSNNDVHGILIQFPVPDHISSKNLLNSLDHIKDVEGFNPFNIGKILIGDEGIIPCTPFAVLNILDYENINLEGKEIVIVNHSHVVGKPLSALFLNRNATVSICHIFTKDLKSHTKDADILVTATGIPGIITKDFVKKNSFVIDVGITEKNKKICGDVDFINVKEIAGRITPVPGGVGPVTVASSLRNMLKTYKKCLEIE